MSNNPLSSERIGIVGQFEISRIFKDSPSPRDNYDITYPSSKEMGIQGTAEFTGPTEAPRFDRAFKRLREFTLDSTNKEWGHNSDDPDYGKSKGHKLEDGTEIVIINEGPNNVSIRVKGENKRGAFYFEKNRAADSRGAGGVLEVRGFGKGEDFELNKALSQSEQLIGTVLATLPPPRI